MSLRTFAADGLVAAAKAFADDEEHETVTPLHLLWVLLQRDDIVLLYTYAGIDIEALKASVTRELNELPERDRDANTAFSDAMVAMLQLAEREKPVSLKRLATMVEYTVDDRLERVLKSLNLREGALRENLAALDPLPEIPSEIDDPERSLLSDLRTADTLDVRAVYADWLEENSRNEEAACVRLGAQIRQILDGNPPKGTPGIAILYERMRLRHRFAKRPDWWQRIVLPSVRG